MDDWVIWIGLAVLILLTVFSSLNLALRVPSRARLANRFEQTGHGEALEAFVAVRQHYLLATAALRSACTLGLLICGLVFATPAEGPRTTVRTSLAAGLVLLLVLVFGVAIPNAWAKYAGETLIVRTLPFLSLIRWVCYPITVGLDLFDPLVRRLAGVPVRDAKSYADELEQQILDAVSEGERLGAVDEAEKEMIESVIELAETRVNEVMTPRTEMVAIPKEADLNTVLDTVRDKGHSRIPVYDGTIDTILGVVYAKDLLQREDGSPFDLIAVMRKALFIPEAKLVRDMLREFQEQKLHIAVVLDEYGGTAGLVTIEDILEELVGEISDEYDPTAPAEFNRIDDCIVELDARMRIDDINHELKIELPEDEDYDTIGGFVFSQLGKVPKIGEGCQHENVIIQVIGAEPRRVTRVRLEVQAPSGDAQGDTR